MLGGDPAELGVEAVAGRDDAHVGRRRLGDHAGDPVAVLRERGLDGRDVVVRQDERLAGLRPGHPGGVREAEGGDPGAGGGEQRVDVAVVAAGELHHRRPAGHPAGEPDRGHRGLGAAADQPDLLDRRHPGDDLLGELDLAGGRRAEAGAEGGRVRDRLHHRGMRVPEDHRPPRADQVHVLPAVRVVEQRAGAGDHEARRAADRPERPDRGVDPARGHRPGPVEEGLGRWRLVRIGHPPSLAAAPVAGRAGADRVEPGGVAGRRHGVSQAMNQS